jgi:ELWxxDGT repeat protein
VLVKDIRQGTTSSFFGNMVELNGIVYFTADDGIYGYEFWKTDGTEAGTVLVKDIYPGVNAGGFFSGVKMGNTIFLYQQTQLMARNYGRPMALQQELFWLKISGREQAVVRPRN